MEKANQPGAAPENSMNATISLPQNQVVREAGALRVTLPDAIEAPRHVFESRRAGRIGYYAELSAPGTPLLLVHSINAAPSAFEMRPLFERFRSRRPVYAIDLPGFGFSDRGDRRYSPRLFADALADFLTEIVKAPTDVAAFSLSSELVALTAPTIPGHIASMTFISPTGFSKRSLPSQTLSERVHKALTLPLLSQGLFDLLTSRPSIRYFLGQAFVGETPPELIDYAYATSHQPGARHAPLYFLSGQLFTAKACERLYAKIETPVLVLYDRDPNVSFDLLPGFVAAHKNWRAERIAPTLGLPHWEKTAETVDAMERFWKTHRGS
jgi:pimeloyl-ACP methyl ester carboxylesterase